MDRELVDESRRDPDPGSAPLIDEEIEVPDRVWRAIAGGRGFMARVLGDSMQPGILDNDTAVVLHRAPESGDVVCVRRDFFVPVYGKVERSIWRYRDGLLSKDNAGFKDLPPKPVALDEIEGVVMRVMPRTARNLYEGHARIQQLRAIERSLGIPSSPDMGFYRDARRDELAAVVTIPATELIAGRLPWGCFRGIAKAAYPHARIRAGDILTIDPSALFSQVGQLVIDRLEDGQVAIGLLRRRGLGSRAPGDFYVNPVEGRIFLTRDHGRLPVSRHLGVITHRTTP